MISKTWEHLSRISFSPFDLLPQPEMREKIAALVLNGIPDGLEGEAAAALKTFRVELNKSTGEDVKVVVFGGGTGLSNIIGGDSRRQGWDERPFEGLKRVFPQTKAVVCVTDNGGSTGQLLKDIDTVALGDIRHVLLSSIQASRLHRLYGISCREVQHVANNLSLIFNYRFQGPLEDDHPVWTLLDRKVGELPAKLRHFLQKLIVFLRTDPRMSRTLQRDHCFGNLLLAAAVLSSENSSCAENGPDSFACALNRLSSVMGVGERGVLPCTTTPSQLLVRYANGVEIPGEHKLDTARRGIPITTVRIEYCDKINTTPEIFQDILEADIIIFAPGSLYSSIIPVLQTPGIADAVRQNRRALKMLISNIWVQQGETDLTSEDPERRFYVSDMLDAYEVNIPGGTAGLFHEVLCVSMRDIPASVLQRYAIEGKVPIYLDRGALITRGFIPVECDIYSKNLLNNRGVIQHDAVSLAQVIRGLYYGRVSFEEAGPSFVQKRKEIVTRPHIEPGKVVLPRLRYDRICKRIQAMSVQNLSSSPWPAEDFKRELIDIFWDHPVIPASHLDFFKDIQLINRRMWGRDQKWDNVFSYFDPEDRCIKILADELTSHQRLELALMVALGESLLGDYAAKKEIRDVFVDGLRLGHVFHIKLRPEEERTCWFSDRELETFFHLARMSRVPGEPGHYYRLININERFTPPGLLMGMTYAWYVDNRLASNIEYKMSVLQISSSSLIPSQLKMAERQRKTIDFFRDVVFLKKTWE
ncbi:YvcK family protein [Desulforhopalus vacuolatus]|uniref:gluconeogenesis factor YvcK family protein n=1 Tax=Desulforhopalus vacuolatus TaxID=40414 RepID=UPI001965CD6E|nr:gluconeogenesis factor YvcK family protein [Desulforhopalus vacuolatus]MBM9519054.1 YvcK family protein [Desulforhopalus vacuolatus]